MSEKGAYPRYAMQVGKEKKWLPLREAGIAYDNGWMDVSICGEVMEETGTVRDTTDEERKKISDIADEYSESK